MYNPRGTGGHLSEGALLEEQQVKSHQHTGAADVRAKALSHTRELPCQTIYAAVLRARFNGEFNNASADETRHVSENISV